MSLHNHSNELERSTEEGESPVEEGGEETSWHLSTTRHEQSCGKLGGPPSKAKELWVTDRETVP